MAAVISLISSCSIFSKSADEPSVPSDNINIAAFSVPVSAWNLSCTLCSERSDMSKPELLVVCHTQANLLPECLQCTQT